VKVLQIERRIVLRSRKIALAVAACFKKCCAPSKWNRANLCNDGDAPPEIPRIITFPAGFTCLDGCPLSGSRIIVYRGYCYFVVDGGGEVECQGPRNKPEEYPAPYSGATVVAWAELLCKPLTATCLDDTCVPVEPGCCTLPYLFNACGSIISCNLPKKFRVRRTAFWRWRSMTYDDPGQCAGLYTCEDMTLEINGYADYACDEGAPESHAYCTNTSGYYRVSGWRDLLGQGIDINGTYPFADGYIGGRFFGLGLYYGISGNVYHAIKPPFSDYPFCGGSHSHVDNPPFCHTQSYYCPGGVRTIWNETANCSSGTLSHTIYNDCFLRDHSLFNRGNSVAPCPTSDIRWDDYGEDRTTISALAGCENAPAWSGGPVGPERPYPYPVAPQSTAEMLGGMA
jgi:hypothetical protein